MDGREEHPIERRENARESAAEAARLASIRAETEQADFRWVLADARGRRVFRRVLAECGWNDGEFLGVGRPTHAGMSEEEGKRVIGRTLRRLARKHCPDLLHLTETEE